MGQLAKQMVERPTRTFDANTEKNSKQECKEVITRSQKQEDVEADKVLQDVSKEEEEDTKREEDDKGEKKNDEVLTPKTKSQLAREAKQKCMHKTKDNRKNKTNVSPSSHRNKITYK